MSVRVNSSLHGNCKRRVGGSGRHRLLQQLLGRSTSEFASFAYLAIACCIPAGRAVRRVSAGHFGLSRHLLFPNPPSAGKAVAKTEPPTQLFASACCPAGGRSWFDTQRNALHEDTHARAAPMPRFPSGWAWLGARRGKTQSKRRRCRPFQNGWGRLGVRDWSSHVSCSRLVTSCCLACLSAHPFHICFIVVIYFGIGPGSSSSEQWWTALAPR